MKLSFLSAPLVVAMVGCGGAVDSDLFGTPGDAAAGTDVSTIKDSSVSDADVPPDASVIDAPPIVDVLPIKDVITVIDSGPTDPGTLCQTNPSSYCKNDSELCCIKPTGSACIASNVANTCSATRMFCDNGDSCKTGEICCGNIFYNGSANVYGDIKCSSSCNVTATTIPGQRRFCNPNTKPDECIQHGLTCKASGILPGYFICSN